ncbi:ribulose phosphate epimerase [bacterium BRH_c32]|nr:MAG: ribulose phosphate epimerase [bacterium BRH_c32]
MKKIAPSILAANFTNLSQQLRYVEAGGADIIHCDIMDGKFVPNISFGPMIVKAVRSITKLPIDCHLMIESPDNYIEEFAKAGANYITVHQEEVKHLHRTIELIKSFDVKAGVVLNPATPISTLSDILDFIDMVLIMSVNPGFGGQKFIPQSLKKIDDLKTLREERNLNFLIEVDGGIDLLTIKSVSEAGCDVFVAGSAIFKSDNITAATLELRNIIN